METVNQLGIQIKALRKERKLLQRQLAALLDMDAPLFSKIERGERTAKKETVIKLSKILKVSKDELLALWLSDQLIEVAGGEKMALQAMQLAVNQLKTNPANKNSK